MQSGLQAIAYFNLQHLPQHLPQPQPQSQRPAGFVTCIILIHLYHPDMLHNSRQAPAEVFISDQVRSRPTYLSGLGATGLLLRRPSSFSSATLTFLKTKLMSVQGRSPSCVQQGFNPQRHQVVLKGDTLHTSTSGWSARSSTIWIICTSVGRSTFPRTYVCQRKRRITSQWRRQFNEKAHCIGWFKRLIRKSESWFERLGSQVTDD